MNQLAELKKITTPFAFGSAHVQGPGGNTSVKADGNLLIKASGYTFKDVSEGNGIALLENAQVVSRLKANVQNDDTKMESIPPAVLESVPPLSRPSMEYEFHSVLGTFVLHTHSVYSNIINCSAECELILKSLFKAEEYLLVPYVTPGFPIASFLVNLKAGKIPPIIFLKNHGIIIHGESSEEVIAKYGYVENVMRKHFNLIEMPELEEYRSDEISCAVKAEKVFGEVDLAKTEIELLQEVLIPDQSIFFRNKVSVKPEADIFLDILNGEIVIKGSSKFKEAAKSMLQAVYYLRKTILSLELKPDFITAADIDILHSLNSEKHRTSLLNK